ncbi:hypothetical protein F2P56_020355 [Juglans regia]|uniref:Homeobox-leucine zipper protein n=2 Tax=Juglans regia TaxID=51240 RepID=A0A6P9F1H2_JUGRE|nr:homeobox-leucine zipper protein ATHB-12-like [Juglans regia]KAF5460491.1 hypothetical protein F2P56_020355 [Juglans regia]
MPESELHNLICSRKNKNMRRFNEEQTKSLEVMFEAESRPEAQVKQQLANELGLRPRQVAIWFQNRRARLKTRQIEREYCMLKASYDNLASNFVSLKRENHQLLIQLQKLKNLLGKQHGNEKGSSSAGESEKGDPIFEAKDKPSMSILPEGDDQKTNMLPGAGDTNCGNAQCSEEETGILKTAQPIIDHGSQTSSDDWCNCFPDDSSGNSQWWELWSSSIAHPLQLT